MPLRVPDLDDRTYEQLVTEARELIPRLCPSWTDHNASDPGIALLELFAYLHEASIYQINRVPDRTLERFAALVGTGRQPGESVDALMGRAVDELYPPDRAITLTEIEWLAKQAAPIEIARAAAAVTTVDEPDSEVSPDDQIVEIVLVRYDDDTGTDDDGTAADLAQRVFEFLRARCLITTRLRVSVRTGGTDVNIRVEVVSLPGSPLEASVIEDSVRQSIGDFLSPTIGGDDGGGWEIGRPVFRSELYRAIEGTAGVDHVRCLWLNGDDRCDSVALAPEAPLPQLQEVAVTVLAP